MRFSTNKQKEKKRKRIKTVEKINSISTAEKKPQLNLWPVVHPSCFMHGMAPRPVPRPEPMQLLSSGGDAGSLDPSNGKRSLSLSAWNMDVRLKRWRGQPALHCICLGSGEEAERNACMGIGQQERRRSRQGRSLHVQQLCIAAETTMDKSPSRIMHAYIFDAYCHHRHSNSFHTPPGSSFTFTVIVTIIYHLYTGVSVPLFP